LRADIDYGLVEARTLLGRIGVKVWIYRGEILREIREPELEVPQVAVAPVGGEVGGEALEQTTNEVESNAATEKGEAPEGT